MKSCGDTRQASQEIFSSFGVYGLFGVCQLFMRSEVCITLSRNSGEQETYTGRTGIRFPFQLIEIKDRYCITHRSPILRHASNLYNMWGFLHT